MTMGNRSVKDVILPFLSNTDPGWQSPILTIEKWNYKREEPDTSGSLVFSSFQNSALESWPLISTQKKGLKRDVSTNAVQKAGRSLFEARDLGSRTTHRSL
jgi:hypothetical protein